MNTFLAILATGLGTYASRSAFILVLADRQIPPNVMLALQYVAPSVLGALVMTMLMGPEGDTAIGAAEFAALAVAGAGPPWRSGQPGADTTWLEITVFRTQPSNNPAAGMSNFLWSSATARALEPCWTLGR